MSTTTTTEPGTAEVPTTPTDVRDAIYAEAGRQQRSALSADLDRLDAGLDAIWDEVCTDLIADAWSLTGIFPGPDNPEWQAATARTLAAATSRWLAAQAERNRLRDELTEKLARSQRSAT